MLSERATGIEEVGASVGADDGAGNVEAAAGAAVDAGGAVVAVVAAAAEYTLPEGIPL